ncbi:MAG: DUF1801 domain-containing protein [Geminicoccaceae bacterium]
MALQVKKVFASYPAPIRSKLMALRRLIFDTATATDGVGPIEETLKWGEPAYLTPVTGSGSTIRLGWKPSAPERYAVNFHCRTTLVDTFRAMFADDFTFEGNRAIVFKVSDPVPIQPMEACIAMALTYHRNKQ